MARKNIIKVCKKNKIKIIEKDFKLNEVINAEEAFVSGTFANIIPVKQINNKKFSLTKNNLTMKLNQLYLDNINNLTIK